MLREAAARKAVGARTPPKMGLLGMLALAAETEEDDNGEDEIPAAAPAIKNLKLGGSSKDSSKDSQGESSHLSGPGSPPKDVYQTTSLVSIKQRIAYRKDTLELSRE